MIQQFMVPVIVLVNVDDEVHTTEEAVRAEVIRLRGLLKQADFGEIRLKGTNSPEAISRVEVYSDEYMPLMVRVLNHGQEVVSVANIFDVDEWNTILARSRSAIQQAHGDRYAPDYTLKWSVERDVQEVLCEELGCVYRWTGVPGSLEYAPVSTNNDGEEELGEFVKVTSLEAAGQRALKGTNYIFDGSEFAGR